MPSNIFTHFNGYFCFSLSQKRSLHHLPLSISFVSCLLSWISPEGEITRLHYSSFHLLRWPPTHPRQARKVSRKRIVSSSSISSSFLFLFLFLSLLLYPRYDVVRLCQRLTLQLAVVSGLIKVKRHGTFLTQDIQSHCKETCHANDNEARSR